MVPRRLHAPAAFLPFAVRVWVVSGFILAGFQIRDNSMGLRRHFVALSPQTVSASPIATLSLRCSLMIIIPIRTFQWSELSMIHYVGIHKMTIVLLDALR